MKRILIRCTRIALLLLCVAPLVWLDSVVSADVAHRELIELTAGAILLGLWMWTLDRLLPVPPRRARS